MTPIKAILKKSRAKIFFALSILLLGIGFYNNQWEAARPRDFAVFQIDCESLIIGRLAKSQQDGIFSSGGLPGRADKLWTDDNAFNYQYNLYQKNLKIHNYHPYKSQIGFQGIFFSFLDYITNFSNEINLNLFKILTSLMSAMALSLVILWVYYEINEFASIALLITSMYSQSLTLFGNNLWWVIWAFYLPMIATMYILFYEEKTGRYFKWLSVILISSTLFIKLLFNGYEYITTTIIMMITPYVYYSYYKRWRLIKFIKRVFFVLVGSATSILISILILIFQISSVEGGFEKGISHLLFSLGKRSFGDPNSYPDEYRDSLQSSIITVLKKYLYRESFDITNIIPNFPALPPLPVVRIYELIFIFIIASILSYFLTKHSKKYVFVEEKKIISLVLTTWFSILAPISWLIIFKAHSYVHLHMNHIIWHMPFTLFGFTLCGLLGYYLFLIIDRSFRLQFNDKSQKK